MFENVLAIDTALGACSVGVLCGDDFFQEQEVMSRGQAEALLPMVKRVMAAASLGYQDLEAIIVTLGPGSFTGVRVGISAAKAFGMALDIPVYGMNSFDALRLGVREGQRTLCVLESKREEFFVQSFYDDKSFPQHTMICSSRIKETVFSCDDDLVIVGDGGIRLQDEFGENDLNHIIFSNQYYPSTKDMGLALQKSPQGPYVTSDISAFYLRGADVSVSKSVQRILA